MLALLERANKITKEAIKSDPTYVARITAAQLTQDLKAVCAVHLEPLNTSRWEVQLKNEAWRPLSFETQAQLRRAFAEGKEKVSVSEAGCKFEHSISPASMVRTHGEKSSAEQKLRCISTTKEELWPLLEQIYDSFDSVRDGFLDHAEVENVIIECVKSIRLPVIN